MSRGLEVTVESLFEGEEFIGNPDLYPLIEVSMDQKQSTPRHPWVTHFQYQGRLLPVKGYVDSKPFRQNLTIFYLESYGTPLLMILHDHEHNTWRLLGMLP